MQHGSPPRPLPQANAHAITRRRAGAAGIETQVGPGLQSHLPGDRHHGVSENWRHDPSLDKLTTNQVRQVARMFIDNERVKAELSQSKPNTITREERLTVLISVQTGRRYMSANPIRAKFGLTLFVVPN
jgi:hypothetical protein